MENRVKIIKIVLIIIAVVLTTTLGLAGLKLTGIINSWVVVLAPLAVTCMVDILASVYYWYNYLR